MELITAYVDPGTGATLMQLALAGTVGIAAVVKLKWHSIKAFFRRSSSDHLPVPTEESSHDEPSDSLAGDGEVSSVDQP